MTQIALAGIFNVDSNTAGTNGAPGTAGDPGLPGADANSGSEGTEGFDGIAAGPDLFGVGKFLEPIYSNHRHVGRVLGARLWTGRRFHCHRANSGRSHHAGSAVQFIIEAAVPVGGLMLN